MYSIKPVNIVFTAHVDNRQMGINHFNLKTNRFTKLATQK